MEDSPNLNNPIQNALAENERAIEVIKQEKADLEKRSAAGKVFNPDVEARRLKEEIEKKERKIEELKLILQKGL